MRERMDRDDPYKRIRDREDAIAVAQAASHGPSLPDIGWTTTGTLLSMKLSGTDEDVLGHKLTWKQVFMPWFVTNIVIPGALILGLIILVALVASGAAIYRSF
jgi:hypothetical protein